MSDIEDLDELRADVESAEGEVQGFLDRIGRALLETVRDAAAAVEESDDIAAAYGHVDRLAKLRTLRQAAEDSLDSIEALKEFIEEMEEEESPPPKKRGKK